MSSLGPGVRRVLWQAVGAAVLAAATCAAGHAAPIVIGQSLPLTGPGFPIANRVLAGARTLVEAVNAAGGVGGQKLELATLDDQGDPRRTAENVRRLASGGAVAIVNCVGERSCLGAADAAREAGVPLIGPLSGAPALQAPGLRHVFTLRPDHVREAQTLLVQLRSVGIRRAVLLGDGSEPASEHALATVMAGSTVDLKRVPIRDGDLDEALRAVAESAPQALLLSLGPASLEQLGRAPATVLAGLPAFVASLSVPGLTQLTRLLRDHSLGFTSVVPIPEISQWPIAREFERDVDALGSPEALSLEGFAAYLHLRLCVEAWRRAGVRAEPAALARAIESLGETQIGGFALRFGPTHHAGSSFIELGLRTRDGRFRR